MLQDNNYSIGPLDRRWSWVEVDLDAVRYNICQAKSKIPSNCKLLAVVKANAYGHGAVEIAKTAIKCGATYLGVASIDEAIALREADIDTNILVFSQPPAESIPLLISYNIYPAIYTMDFAIQYAEAADKLGKIAPYHLTVNTGMNRLGVRHNEVIDFLKKVNFHRALKLEGTFTHFATADTLNELDFRKQLVFFDELIERMKNNGFDPGIVHAANTAAIYKYPEAHYDMVRLGVATYGYPPSDVIEPYLDVKQAMSVHARIIDERILAMGEGVSYGLNYRARNSVKICTLPIGYADGIPWNLAGKIGVIYKGKIFPQVGTICMDMIMFEIDMNSGYAQEHYNAQIGDEVMLVGQEGDAKITIDDLAKASGTIADEVMCSLCKRMPIIYKQS